MIKCSHTGSFCNTYPEIISISLLGDEITSGGILFENNKVVEVLRLGKD